MQQVASDRRTLCQSSFFPLTDSKGKQVKFERRDGLERRKEQRISDIARSIISLVN